jgi:Galactose oxidase, central domain
MIGRRLLVTVVVTFLAACGGGPSSTSPTVTGVAMLRPVATPTVAVPSPTSSPTPVVYSGVFTPTASMTTARNGHTATLLPNGLVLIAGGQEYSGAALASAELYDPATGSFKLTGSMHAARTMHTATLLLDGRVLIAGGGKTIPSPAPEAPSIMGLACCEPVTSAELYDPATGTFTVAGNMTVSRFPSMTATLLMDGRVLFAGGHAVLADGSMGEALASAELYDPASGTFRATGSMTVARYGHSATLLQNGQVLVAGGQAGPQGSNSMSAELYDPASGTFRPTGNLDGNGDAYHTATLLTNGWVLIVGEGDYDNLSHPELYIPERTGSGLPGAFVPTSTTAGRFTATATLLADGRVLVAGGTLGGNLASAVLFDPVTQTFAATRSLSVPRHGQTATLLNDGRVLIAGGTDDGNNPIDSAELFH